MISLFSFLLLQTIIQWILLFVCYIFFESLCVPGTALYFRNTSVNKVDKVTLMGLHLYIYLYIEAEIVIERVPGSWLSGLKLVLPTCLSKGFTNLLFHNSCKISVSYVLPSIFTCSCYLKKKKRQNLKDVPLLIWNGITNGSE